MPNFWLTIAIVLYGFGLAYSLFTLHGRREKLEPFIITMVRIGALFHFVSLAESVWSTGQITLLTTQKTESLLAFLLMVFFFFTYWRLRSFSHGIFVFPLVVVLTLFTAIGVRPVQFPSPVLRSGWIFSHIALILAGYAALFFSFSSSILYLVQERSLKTRSVGGIASRLPALQVIDEIGFRSLILGFPFMTLGLIAGSVIAEASYGPMFLRDPKIVLSIIMWAVYMVLLFTRWTAGWRGRRAAVLSTVAFLAATLAWAANYISGVHRFTP
ncbi:MAG TPA: cytochrome c biogenesis protein CcsA [Terriglobales bacterium]|nr:cytochrome c biogenesis protein CcsA [Terriglobales bacterium]